MGETNMGESGMSESGIGEIDATDRDLVREETLQESSVRYDPPIRWFLRGTAVGMLLMAAVNALSYFFRSSDWTSLVQPNLHSKEAIGFPFVVWEAGNTYGGMFADYPRLGLNVAVAAAVGSLLGWYTARKTPFLNGLLTQLETESIERESQPIQFSLRGLMIATTVIAVTATLARNFAARPETLIAIYLFGPLLLCVIAMLPRNLSWEKRVVLIIPATFLLIAVAIAVGTVMNMEFDKVLMGVFLSWTPQSALAAVGLTGWLLRDLARNESTAVVN